MRRPGRPVRPQKRPGMPYREQGQTLNAWRVGGCCGSAGGTPGRKCRAPAVRRRLVSGLVAMAAEFGVEAGGEEQAGDEQEAGVNHATPGRLGGASAITGGRPATPVSPPPPAWPASPGCWRSRPVAGTSAGATMPAYFPSPGSSPGPASAWLPGRFRRGWRPGRSG